ncbi:acyl-CoA synthetase (AMP-forming)/AMP-acid ligase II [Paraburkholderia sp. BL6665CI2N2]|uniref:class I adenylate-forming enzyme family protein n=1 Tax=Paraburkholderia sp. BL6665CI2N2 TaxID=1938806 RepID=UPI001064A99C|nr:long-chain-fatty-acid--CoA ligase [Paraburkholderia sp. BL6665CI2N2]TDY16822.1 acyl-CoA synthetase (AMP-forming)/AMP-acid ligase II [Paraburkholderia sp. BL6665CI2N2]
MKLLADIHERNAFLASNSPAVFYEGRTQTFAEYWSRINRIADGIYMTGARHQDRVALLSMNRLEYIEVYGACERAGFIMTTVNFRLSASEIEYVLRDSAPHTLIFEDQYTDIVDSLRPGLNIHNYVCLGNTPDWAQPYEALADSGSLDGPPIRTRADDVAVLMYTSGTTGRPKGVMRTQRGEARQAETMSNVFSKRGDSRQLIMMPLFHVGARCLYYSTFWLAGAVHVQRKFDPKLVLETIQNYRVTHLHLVPTMVADILNVPEINSYDLSSVELLLYAAAPMPVSLLKRGIATFGNVMGNGYGSTESNFTFLAPHQHHPDGTPEQIARLGSVGQSFPDVEMRILDDEGTDCPIGTPGEVVCRSDSLMAGYWNNGPATVEAMRDGWYHTGDMGYLDHQGYLFLVDRKKDMIITGGENVYCREVETAIERHPDVHEVAVIGVPDEKWGESVRAVVVLRPGASLTEAELIAFSRQQIAHYKAPKSVIFVDELPRVQTGKISKVALREQFKHPVAGPNAH